MPKNIIHSGFQPVRLRGDGLVFRALLAAFVFLLGSAQVAATTFLPVNDFRDDVDLNPGDGQCKAVNGNFCTLRAAIQEANALITTKGITDIVINLMAPGTYTLTRPGTDDNAANGDLDILGTCPSADLNVPCLTITGMGKGVTIIDGGGIDRVFHFVGRNTVKITGVTIQGGFAKNANGGGIRNSNGWVVLENSEVINNTAKSYDAVDASFDGKWYSGGGIYNANNARMEIRNSRIANNKLINPPGPVFAPNPALEFVGGGGIFTNGDMTIKSKTEISQNEGHPYGAGIANASGLEEKSGRLTITDTFLQGNKNTNTGADISGPYGRGGALSNHGGVVTITRTIIGDNQDTISASNQNEAGIGAGIYNTNGLSRLGTVTGIVRLTSSVVDGNIGNGIVNLSSLDISYSTIRRNNAATSGIGASGGGINNNGPGGLVVVNSTITGNTALQSGGGISNDRGATLTHATVSGNSAPSGKEIFIRTQNAAGDRTIFENTIIGDNTLSTNNCAGDTNYLIFITSRGHNLEHGDSCGLTESSDLKNINPNLAPLADNTSVTPFGPGSSADTLLPDNTYPKTLLPQSGSPAIDNASCVSGFDQRQFGRPGGNGCDIGAVEADSNNFSPAKTDLEVLKTANFDTVGLNTELTYTLVVNNKGPSDASSVTLTDRLPGGVDFARWAIATGSAAGNCSYSISSNQLVCTMATLKSGETFTVFVVVKPSNPSLVDKLIENRAAVTVGSPSDYLPGNNGSLDACVRGACAVTSVKADTVINTPPGGGGGAFGALALALFGLPAVLLLRRRST